MTTKGGANPSTPHATLSTWLKKAKRRRPNVKGLLPLIHLLDEAEKSGFEVTLKLLRTGDFPRELRSLYKEFDAAFPGDTGLASNLTHRIQPLIDAGVIGKGTTRGDSRQTSLSLSKTFLSDLRRTKPAPSESTPDRNRRRFFSSLEIGYNGMAMEDALEAVGLAPSSDERVAMSELLEMWFSRRPLEPIREPDVVQRLNSRYGRALRADSVLLSSR